MSDREFIDALVARLGRQRSSLVAMLLAIQDRDGYLDERLLCLLSDATAIPRTDIRGVSTFYQHFRHRPVGEHIISVCIGTACHVRGAEHLYRAFREHLAIPDTDDTDGAGRFTVEKVACLGCCMLAPAVKIDDTVYGWVEPSQVGELLDEFLAAAQTGSEARTAPTDQGGDAEVNMCTCSSCRAAGADEVYRELCRLAVQYGLAVRLLDVGCTGMSFRAPLVQVTSRSGEVFHYGRVTVEQVGSILLHHYAPGSLDHWLDGILDGGRDKLCCHRLSHDDEDTSTWLDSPNRVVTAGCGLRAPLDLTAYREAGGFTGLAAARDRGPAATIAMIKDSGLRGRGGAGFPAGQKWALVAEAATTTAPLIVCNADEGDPGAFMDRMLLESFPFRVLEGMLIAASAVGSDCGYIYVRREYPLAVTRIRRAITILEAAGILGEGFSLTVVEGAGAFVCGEETALLASIEGSRGIPRRRPPYPSEWGLFARPTLVNNVETFATVPWILTNGVERFRAVGTAGSPGTKTFALAGKILRGGLIEVPMGCTLAEVIEDIGGGAVNGRQVKAVQVGGPSGGCVPAQHFDLPIDYEALQQAGAIMGSGGLVVLDDTDCMVDIARYFLDFTVQESCGICTSCRVGSRRMLDVLERICQGRGRAADLEQLVELASLMERGSRCGLGKTAPKPVLSTMLHFRHEYEAHLAGHCPAGVCRELTRFVANQQCNGCMLCSRICPVEAIPYQPWQTAEIDQALCIRCGACRQQCPEGAIEAVKPHAID